MSKIDVMTNDEEAAMPDRDDATETEAPESATQRESVTEEPKAEKSRGRQISVSVRALVIAILIVGWVATAAVLTWMYLGEKDKVAADAQREANNHRAEQISLDYAVKAAKIDYKDLDSWKKNLTANTTPELRDKLNEAGKSMEQLLVPLQWNSSATPLVAKVRSQDKGVYIVDTFVGVNTKTMQAPEGLQSTATYSVTVDSNHDWQISEVGGIGSVVGEK